MTFSDFDRELIEDLFPSLVGSGYRITSPVTLLYNCLAWAIGDLTRPWWPEEGSHFWPVGIPAEPTVDSFTSMLRIHGYERCDDPSLEIGYEKLTLYVDASGEPAHVSKQLESGAWSSKLGNYYDIEHPSLDTLQVPEYGSPSVFFRRLSNSPK